jgi:hypothetical protein
MGIPEYQTLPSQAESGPSTSRLGRAVLGVIWWSLLLVLCLLAMVGVGAIICAGVVLAGGEFWYWGLALLAATVALGFAIAFVGKQVEAVGRIRRRDIDWKQHF